MGPEQDSDEEVTYDWRSGDSYAKALMMPSEYQQSVLLYKQKKITTSSNTKSISTTEMTAGAKSERSLKASAGGVAAPVVYDLSDSEGTPAPRSLGRSVAERRAAVAKPASAPWKQIPISEVVTLDSDSDEEVSTKSTVKSSVKVEKLCQPITKGGSVEKDFSLDVDLQAGFKVFGEVDIPRHSALLRAALEKLLPVDDENKVGAKLPEQVGKSREEVSPGESLGTAITVGDWNPVVEEGKKSPGKVLKTSETIPEGGLLGRPISRDMEGTVGLVTLTDTRAPVQPPYLPPRRDDRSAILAAPTPGTFPAAVDTEDLARQNNVSSLDNVPRSACISRKRPSLSVEGINESDSEQGVSRKRLSPEPNFVREEENMWASPDHPGFQDLTCSDDDIYAPPSEFQLSGVMTRESVQMGAILRKDPPVGDHRMGSSTPNAIDIDLALAVATAYVADHSTWWDDDLPEAGPSATVDPFAVKPNKGENGNVGACDDLPTSCSSGELPDNTDEGVKTLEPAQGGSFRAANVRVNEEARRISPAQPIIQDLSSDDEGCAEQILPNSGRNREVGERGGGREKLVLNIPGLTSYENRQAAVSSSPTRVGPGQIEVRNSFRSAEVCVRRENRTISPVQPVVQDLSSDDDEQPEWLRRAHESLSLRGSLDSPVRCDFESQELLDDDLGTYGGKKRRCSKKQGFESEENFDGDKARRKRCRPAGAAPGRGVLDDASNKENKEPTIRKNSRARKGPLSEEEVLARAEQKQRELELKKARQEEEKRAKEDKKEEARREREAAKEAAKLEKEKQAEKKRQEKEIEKELKGSRTAKFALKNTVIHLDTKVVEMKDVGPLIAQQLHAKEYKYELHSHPIKRTILWTMKHPSADSQTDVEGLESQSQADDVVSSQVHGSQIALEEVEIKYVVVVLDGEEFAELVSKDRLHGHLSEIQKQYPAYSVCYIINGLTKFINKQDQEHFKKNDRNWKRPNVEQALAEFISHHPGVQSRLCIDAAEIADHIVGLTRSLAGFPFKKKLTSVSVHANGDHVTKHDPNKDVVKKCVWLKFLVAIPRVNGATAMAIKERYPTMRALLDVYLDPHRTDHEKDQLLVGLVKEYECGIASSDGRKVGPQVSRRVYRVMMAKDGSLSTEDAEEGADHFTGDAAED